MRRVLPILVSALALVAGCRPAPTSTPPPPPPAPTGVIVTPGWATLTPPPTNTPPFDALAVLGRWLFDFRFDFTDGLVIDETYFVLSVGAEVDGAGRVSGRGEFATMVNHAGCDARVTGGRDFWARLSGQVEQDDDGDLFFELTLSPEDTMLEQVYQLYCPDYSEEYASQLLWYALRTAGIESFYLPARPGAHEELAEKITSSTRDELNWHMQVTIRASR
jgi:hypothetical protein